MQTYIALLRGINVGGKNTLKMKDLISLLEELGAQQVKTYIQSGKVVFLSHQDSSQLTEQIKLAINQRFGFTPLVLLLSLDEFKVAIHNNPFPEAESNPGSLHLGFLVQSPNNPDLDGLKRLKGESEQFHLIDKVFYLYAPEGIGRSKLAANSEKLLGVPMTDRNWKTICKIQEMAAEDS